MTKSQKCSGCKDDENINRYAHSNLGGPDFKALIFMVIKIHIDQSALSIRYPHKPLKRIDSADDAFTVCFQILVKR